MNDRKPVWLPPGEALTAGQTAAEMKPVPPPVWLPAGQPGGEFLGTKGGFELKPGFEQEVLSLEPRAPSRRQGSLHPSAGLCSAPNTGFHASIGALRLTSPRGWWRLKRRHQPGA